MIHSDNDNDDNI